MSSFGIEAITGKPYKPTTQGKNERFHQTVFRRLDKNPLADSLDELQAQVDRFDLIYNTERPHQGLPGRITPQQSWDATAVAAAPQHAPVPVLIDPVVSHVVADTEPAEARLRVKASCEPRVLVPVKSSIARPAAVGRQQMQV